jgi:hypothetical protein
VKPVVTASVGKVSSLEEKPTCVNDPVVGTIYNDSVELNDTVVLFGEMVHAVVVESGSRVNVTLVATVAHDGEPVVPTYASPIFHVRKARVVERTDLTVGVENWSTVWTVTQGICSICVKEDARFCCPLVMERCGAGQRQKCQKSGSIG